MTPSRTEKATVLETEDKLNQTFGEIQVVEEPDSGDLPESRSTDQDNMYYSERDIFASIISTNRRL